MWRAISNSAARDWDASLYFCLSSTESTINRSQWGLEVFLQSLSDLNLSLSEYLLFFQDIMIFPRKRNARRKKEKSLPVFPSWSNHTYGSYFRKDLEHKMPRTNRLTITSLTCLGFFCWEWKVCVWLSPWLGFRPGERLKEFSWKQGAFLLLQPLFL